MSILNQNNYPFLNNPISYKIHGGEPVTEIGRWDDANYWMLEFISSDTFQQYKIKDVVPEDIYNEVKNGTTIKLLLSHISEAYHSIVEEIYKCLIIEQNIPIENIVLLTNSADIEIEIDIVSKKYNLPKFKSGYMATFEYGAKGDMFRYPEVFQVDTLTHKNYEKKFLSLNGLWRPHRVLLGAFLIGLKVIDKGHISLNSVSCDYPTMKDFMFNEIVRWNQNNPKILQLLMENEQEIKSIDKICLDEDITHRASYTGLSSKYYQDTYFSIVTETSYGFKVNDGYTGGRALSEKTFKPILFKHPFLLLARPRALQLLKQLGYRTFSDYIDESYDYEEDESKRVYMVAKQAERLCNLNGDDLRSFIDGCREITEHNFNVLKNKQNFLYWKT